MRPSFFITINISDIKRESYMIEINEKTYDFKYSLRALFMWEEITGKPFEIKTTIDMYVLCYVCLLVGSEKELDFNEFIDACDADPSIIDEFNVFMGNEMKKRSMYQSKKKVTRKGKSSR